MPDEELGIRLAIKDRAKFSEEAKRARTDVDNLGKAAQDSDKKARNASVGWGTLIKSFVGLNVIQSGINMLTSGVRDLVGMGVDLAKTGADVDAVQRRYTTVFGVVTPQVDAFIKTTSQQLGIPTKDLEDAAARFGVLGQSAKIAQDKLPGFSEGMVKAGVDLAAFYNVDAKTTFTALRSGLTGMTRPLRQYGIFVDEANIKNKAMSLGLGASAAEAQKAKERQETLAIAQAKATVATQKYGSSSVAAATANLAVQKAQDQITASTNNVKLNLDDATKVMLRQAIITDQLGAATGAAGKLIDTPAGQWRMFRGRLQEVVNTISLSLLPVGGQLLSWINKGIGPALTWLSDHVTGWATKLGKEIDVARRIIHTLFILLSGSDPIHSAARYLDDLTGSNGRLYTAINYVVGVARNLWIVLTRVLIPTVQTMVRDAIVPAEAAAWLFGGALSAIAGDAPGYRTALEIIVGGYVAIKTAILVNRGLIIADNIGTATALGLRLALTWATRGYAAAAAQAALANDAEIFSAGVLSAVMNSMLVRLIVQVTWWTAVTAARLIDAASIWIWNAAVYAAALATDVWTAGLLLADLAMTLLTLPIVLIIAGIALLVAGAIYAYFHFKIFRNAVDAVGDAILAVYHWIASNWPLLLAIIVAPFAVAAYEVYKHWDAIKQGASAVWHFIQDIWNKVWKFIFTPLDASKLFNGLKTAFHDALVYIATAWTHMSFELPIPGHPTIHASAVFSGAIAAVLHEGGTVTSGGLVNMRPGEEMVVLPPKATVVPLTGGTVPNAARGGITDGRPIVLQLVVDKKVLAETTFDYAGDRMARA